MTDISDLTRDRGFLDSLISGNFKLPHDIDPYSFCLGLLPNLGSPDPVLRDDLSATIIDHFVSDPGTIAGDQAASILAVLLDDNHLFWRIGEDGTDSVFMRSFSSLLASSIIYRDSLSPAIGKDLIRGCIDRLLDYSSREKDIRGYVEGKGWAHSVAHLSDALYACAGHPEALREQVAQILDTTGGLSRQENPLSSGEPERLAYAACRAINSLDVTERSTGWIGDYPIPEGGRNSPYARHNSGAFLRSLYFDLKWEKAEPPLLEAIERKLRDLDPLHRNVDAQ